MTAQPRPRRLFGLDLGELHHVVFGEMALRFAFGAAISVIAGVGGIVLGSTVGGMLLAFPAIAPATLTLIEKKDGTAAAVSDVGGAVLGGVGLVAFAVVGDFLFGTIVAPAVLVASLVAWSAVSIFFYVLRARGWLPLPEMVRDVELSSEAAARERRGERRARRR